ncbi:hypothetical protein Pmani_016669 [Petrolisthes manimaculis]|uniref:Uncharacterized protein n=1 Tax=Petrolisthes manimaculis TaxID=1843537 RepID=A0AAE1UAA3_9EUCA|nr:hypothetical protein Pmani_016669 [Petrolisthes manimaculis]
MAGSLACQWLVNTSAWRLLQSIGNGETGPREVSGLVAINPSIAACATAAAAAADGRRRVETREKMMRRKGDEKEKRGKGKGGEKEKRGKGKGGERKG